MSTVLTACREAGYLPLPETPLQPNEGLSAHYLDVFAAPERVTREGSKVAPSWLSGAHGENLRSKRRGVQESEFLNTTEIPVDATQSSAAIAEALSSIPVKEEVSDQEEPEQDSADIKSGTQELLRNRRQVLQLLEELTSLDPKAASAAAKALQGKNLQNLSPSLVTQLANARAACGQAPIPAEESVEILAPVDLTAEGEGKNVNHTVDSLAQNLCTRGFDDEEALMAAAVHVHMDRIAGANIFHEALSQRLVRKFKRPHKEVKELLVKLDEKAREVEKARTQFQIDDHEEKKKLKSFYKGLKEQLNETAVTTQAYTSFTDSFQYQHLFALVKQRDVRVNSVEKWTDQNLEHLGLELDQLLVVGDMVQAAERAEEHELPRYIKAGDDMDVEIADREQKYSKINTDEQEARKRRCNQLQSGFAAMKADWQAVTAETEDLMKKAQEKEEFRRQFEEHQAELERKHKFYVDKLERLRREEEEKIERQKKEMEDLESRFAEATERTTKSSSMSQNLEFQQRYLEGELTKILSKEVDRQVQEELKRYEQEIVWKHVEAKNQRDSQKNELKAAKQRLAKLKKEKRIRDLKKELIETHEEIEQRREELAKLNTRLHESKVIIEPNGVLDRKLEDCEHFLQKHGQPWRYDRATFEIVEKGEIRMPMKLLRAYRHVHRRHMWKTCSVKSPLMVRWLAISSRRPDSAPAGGKKTSEWCLLPTQKNLSGAVNAPWRRYLLQAQSCCNLGASSLDRHKDRENPMTLARRNDLPMFAEGVGSQSGIWLTAYEEFLKILEDAEEFQEHVAFGGINEVLSRLKACLLDSAWVARFCFCMQGFIASDTCYTVEDSVNIDDPAATLDWAQSTLQERMHIACSVLSALKALQPESTKLNEDIEHASEECEDVQDKLSWPDILSPSEIKAIPKMQRQVKLRLKCLAVAVTELKQTVSMLDEQLPQGRSYLSSMILKSRGSRNLVKATQVALQACRTGLEAELAHLGFSGSAGELTLINSPEMRLDLKLLDFPAVFRGFVGSDDLDFSIAEEELPALLKGEPSADVEVMLKACDRWVPSGKRPFRQAGISFEVDARIHGIQQLLKLRKKLLRKREEELRGEEERQASKQTEDEQQEELDGNVFNFEDEGFPELEDDEDKADLGDAPIDTEGLSSELSKHLESRSRTLGGTPIGGSPVVDSRASTPMDEQVIGAEESREDEEVVNVQDKEEETTTEAKGEGGVIKDGQAGATVPRKSNWGKLQKSKTLVNEKVKTSVFGSGKRASLDGAREALAANPDELAKFDALAESMGTSRGQRGTLRRETVKAAGEFFGMVAAAVAAHKDALSGETPLPPAPLPPALQSPPDCTPTVVMKPRISAAWANAGAKLRAASIFAGRGSVSQVSKTLSAVAAGWQLQVQDKPPDQSSSASSATSEASADPQRHDEASEDVTDKVDAVGEREVGEDDNQSATGVDETRDAVETGPGETQNEVGSHFGAEDEAEMVAAHDAGEDWEDQEYMPPPGVESIGVGSTGVGSEIWDPSMVAGRSSLMSVGADDTPRSSQIKMQPSARGSLRSASPDPYAQRESSASRGPSLDAERRSWTPLENLDLADGPVDTALDEEAPSRPGGPIRPKRVIRSPSPMTPSPVPPSPAPQQRYSTRSTFFRSDADFSEMTPEPTRPTSMNFFMQANALTPDLIRAASPAWVTEICRKTAAERARALGGGDHSDEEVNEETPTPPPMLPRDRPPRLAYSQVPPRQRLLPLGGADGRSMSPACPPQSLVKNVIRQRVAAVEAQRPRPQTTEPRQAPKSPRRPHSVIGATHSGGHQATRPHSVMDHGLDPDIHLSLTPQHFSLSPEPQQQATAPPRPHSVMAHGPRRPHSVAGEAQRPHSVLGSAPSSSARPAAPFSQSSYSGSHGNRRRPVQGQNYQVPDHSQSPEPRQQSVPRNESPESREPSIARNPHPDVVQRFQTPREIASERSAQRSHTSKPPTHSGLGSVTMTWKGISQVSKQAKGVLRQSNHDRVQKFDYSKDGVSRMQAHDDVAMYRKMNRTAR